MKFLKKMHRFLGLVSAIVIAVIGLHQAYIQYQQEQVLGASDDSGFEQVIVARVIDGDTIELTDDRKVRYIGVDTPETRHPQRGVECFGLAAKDRNKELVEGAVVQLEKDVSDTDRYGRLLRYVWKDEQLVNQVLVEEGYAYAASFPPDIAKQHLFRNSQEIAQNSKAGLWGDCEIRDLDAIQNTIDTTDY